MMTSLGTCRLVMPLSEFTIASGGPLRVDGLHVGFDRGLALVRRQRLDLGVEVADAVVRVDAQLLERVARASSNTSLKNTVTAWPKMIGSDTFIMVAFRCSENSTPSLLGVRRSALRRTRAAPSCS